jgi:3',5'-cyclic AMP phosphodiesterase CpdA
MTRSQNSFLDVKTCNGAPELTILHISDLHFGPPFVDEVAEAALHVANELGPDVVVVSGDLTQRARREQFLAAKEYLGRFPEAPMLIIPGNHDVPLYRVVQRLTNPHANYTGVIGTDLNPILRLDSAVIVGLDSTAPRSSISNGRIHAWQLDHCEQAFADAPENAAKIVVAHHHFTPAPD